MNYKFKIKGTKNIYDLEIEKNGNGNVSNAYCTCKEYAITRKPCKHIMNLKKLYKLF